MMPRRSRSTHRRGTTPSPPKQGRTSRFRQWMLHPRATWKTLPVPQKRIIKNRSKVVGGILGAIAGLLLFRSGEKALPVRPPSLGTERLSPEGEMNPSRLPTPKTGVEALSPREKESLEKNRPSLPHPREVPRLPGDYPKTNTPEEALRMTTEEVREKFGAMERTRRDRDSRIRPTREQLNNARVKMIKKGDLVLIRWSKYNTKGHAEEMETYFHCQDVINGEPLLDNPNYHIFFSELPLPDKFVSKIIAPEN